MPAMRVTIEILHEDFFCDFSYDITVKAFEGSGPTYSSGGEQPSPMEYEISDVHISKGEDELELPKWLEDVVIDHLLSSDEVYSYIEDDNA